MKKVISAVISFTLLLTLFGCSNLFPEESLGGGSPEDILISQANYTEPVKSALEDIVILYTNDVHCAVDEGAIGYETVSSVKASLEAAGKYVLVVDSGDAIQGNAIGSFSEGESIVNIMNEVGYDAMALGNHEFDYGIDRLIELSEEADFEFLSCNFKDASGETVFEPYTIVECEDISIAFVGITTPMTYNSSTPTFFQDGNGNLIYSFSEDSEGDELAEAVNEAAAAARSEGADYVIALSHLGFDYNCSPYTSTEIIHKIEGIDVFLDGHSHTVLESLNCIDKNGNCVLLSQTGTKFANIGMLTFDADGKITAKLLDASSTASVIDSELTNLNEIASQVVGSTPFDLTINDPSNPDLRIVRLTETNLGDLTADSMRAYTGADIAFCNGGGIRAAIPAGDITGTDVLAVFPFCNYISMISLSGQQILDALEYSVSFYPNEFGGFLQVSGITFDVDVNIQSGVVTDDLGMFVSIEGEERRVSNVMVNGEAIDPNATYSVAGNTYTLLNEGDGYTMFDGAEVLLESSVLDHQVFMNYISSFDDGIVSEDYSNPYGSGRINFINQ